MRDLSCARHTPSFRGALLGANTESRHCVRLDSGSAPRGASRNDDSYQLRLKPAEMLLFGAPCKVSPIEPETLTPPNNCCSAPILRSHLSSVDDSVWPAMKLVPVSAMLSFADWSSA